MSDDFGDKIVELFREKSEIDWKPVENSEICNFYAGKHILVTGATGFLGKLAVEKLLRASPNLEKIYILVREKRGKNVEDRLKTIYSDPVYGPLTKLYPNFREKIHLITGDVAAPNLGLSPENESLLTSKLNVIFHIAATVRFDEPLPIAIKTNLRATRDLIRLAHRCPNLTSFVHVSTAYANPPQKENLEQFYPFPIHYDDLIKMAEERSDKLATTQFDVIKGWPNTYSFTKAAAEACVQSLGAGLPICIVRPAVVVSTLSEPLTCWIDNLSGTTGVIVWAGLGLLKNFYCDSNVKADLVPGDYVINAMIVAAQKTAIETNKDKIKIYNFVTDEQNPITWHRYFTQSEKWCRKWGQEVPAMRCMSDFSLNLIPNYWLFSTCMLLHLIPVYLIDIEMMLMGKEPKFVNYYNKIWKIEGSKGYFCSRDWGFSNVNTKALWSSLNEADKQAFPFCMADFKWDEYIKSHVLGFRKYIINNNLLKMRWGNFNTKSKL